MEICPSVETAKQEGSKQDSVNMENGHGERDKENGHGEQDKENGHGEREKENGDGERDTEEFNSETDDGEDYFNDFEVLESFGEDSQKLNKKLFPILVNTKLDCPFSIPCEKTLLEKKLRGRRSLFSPYFFSLAFSEKSTLSEISNTALIFKPSYALTPYLACSQKFLFKLADINSESLFRHNLYYDNVHILTGAPERRAAILPCMLRIDENNVELNLLSRFRETWGIHRVQQASISSGGFRSEMKCMPGQYIHLFAAPPPPHFCYYDVKKEEGNQMIIRQHYRAFYYQKLYESKTNLIQVYGCPTTIPSSQYICLGAEDQEILDSCTFRDRVYGVVPADSPRDLNMLLNQGEELYLVDSGYMSAQCLKTYGFFSEDILWIPHTRDEIRSKIRPYFSGEGKMDVDRFLDLSLINVRNLFSDSGFNLLFISLPSGSILRLTPALIFTLVLKHRENNFTLVN